MMSEIQKLKVSLRCKVNEAEKGGQDGSGGDPAKNGNQGTNESKRDEPIDISMPVASASEK